MTRFWRIWKAGGVPVAGASVHVSMNDYLIRRARDIPRVGAAGMRFRRAWPETEGALGLWFASSCSGRRQVSVSIWESSADLRRFVSSPGHLRVMREHRATGDLRTNAWTAERFDPGLIWRQAEDRLLGRVPGVSHH